MKRKYLRVVAGVLLLSFTVPSVAQEGHPSWWWRVKGADVVVEGTITYTQTSYYEVTPVNTGPQNAELKDKKYYWLVGNLQISKVLFVNRHSEHLEAYQQYIKKIHKEHKILIPAYRSELISTHVKKTDQYFFHPLLLDIPDSPSIYALTNVFLFPLLNLKLEAGVPTNEIPEARKLVSSRKNNLIGSHQ